MAENQIIGDSMSLGKNVTNPPTNDGGSVNADLIGDSMSLSRNEVLPPTHGSMMGEVQQIGDSMSLGRSAVDPWPQASPPMTDLGGGKK